MKTGLFLAGAAGLALLTAIAYVRFTTVDASSGVGRPEARAPGDYPSTGGFYAVRPAQEVDVAALNAAILATPRTERLSDGTYVTRTPLWSFPDIVHVWEEGGNVHLASNLVYGRSDLGTNKARVERWLAAAAS